MKLTVILAVLFSLLSSLFATLILWQFFKENKEPTLEFQTAIESGGLSLVAGSAIAKNRWGGNVYPKNYIGPLRPIDSYEGQTKCIGETK